MNFISQAASTRGTHKGMHDGEGTTGAWQREGTAGTHDGERTSGAWQEGGHDRGAWQGHGGRARQGGMTGGMAGEHDRGMTGGTSSLPRITATRHSQLTLT